MPVYEYRCPDCTNLFERLVSFSDRDREVNCPTCGVQASKLLSTFAAIGVAGGSSSADAQVAPMGGGRSGCCGSGCCGGA